MTKDATISMLEIENEKQLLEALKENVGRKRSLVTTKCSQSAGPDDTSLRLNLSRLDKIIEHVPEDQVISVETGITLKALDDTLSKFGQFFPVPAVPDTTLFDLICTGDGGMLENAYGPVRDLILGLWVATASGEKIKTGGKVVKNVTGYDTTKLFVGSRGWLGIPYVAHLRLYARPESSETILLFSKDVGGLLSALHKLQSTGISFSALELCGGALLDSNVQLDVEKPLLQPGYFALIVQMCGHERLLKEIVPQVQSFFPAALTQVKIKDGAESALVQKLFALDKWQLDSFRTFISLPASLIESALAVLPALDWPLLSYRAATARLTFFSTSEERSVRIGDYYLAKFSNPAVSQSFAPITVAYATPQGAYKCVHDPQTATIIKSLKQQFDPDACLNPQVQF